MKAKRSSARVGALGVLCAAVLPGQLALAQQQQQQQQQRGIIDQIVVTATKRETTLQDTAVAVSAFDQSMLDAMNITQMTDVQFSVPNLHFTQGNFSNNSLAIRGIGNNVVAASGDGGVGVHFNGAYLQNSSIFESEFFDVERIEVLRGPQGTLYGRNTTGGAVNIIPARANTEQMEGSLDLELGNYQTRLVKGMFNLPLSDTLAVRLSGVYRERDGFVENTFTGNDIDDRELWAFRLAGTWDIGDRSDVNFFWQRFREDDSRMRTSNQTCPKDDANFPFSLGCLPNQDLETFGIINSQAQLGGILGFLTPNLGAGVTYLPAFTDTYAGTVRPDDLRKVATPVDPTYKFDEDIVNLEFTHNFDNYELVLSGSYQKAEFLSETDYAWNVPSVTFNPNVSFDALFGLDPGTLGLGYTDADGIMITPSDPRLSGFDRPLATDTSAFSSETWTAEARLLSDWTDSPWDFLLGTFYMTHDNNDVIYDVRANTLANLAPVEFAPGPDGFDAPVAYYRSDTQKFELETWALFGELYYDLSMDTRLTAGLRYTWEEKQVADRQTLLNDLDRPHIAGISNRAFLNDSLAPFVAPAGVGDRLFHGFGVGDNNPVPPYRAFSESWNEVTGKLGVEHNIDLGFTNDTMLHLTLSRSYKSGGINPPSFTGAFEETFDPEYINAIEIGAKNTLLDGAMQLNLAYFFYDYDGMQTTKIIDRTSVNENIDAEIQGVEFELSWFATENFRIDAFVAYMDTKITGGESLNPADPTNGDPNWITVKNVGADVFIAPNPATGQTFDPSMCGNGLECAAVFESAPIELDDTDPNFGQALATQPNLVQVPLGIPVELNGNRLVNTPKWSVKLGAEYNFPLRNGWELTPRVDFYWQDDFYYRIYNSRQDKVSSWTQINASLSLTSMDNRWYASAFVKNLRDDDHITGAYFTDYSSANFTNVFLLEPRTYGIQIGARF